LITLLKRVKCPDNYELQASLLKMFGGKASRLAPSTWS